MTVSEPHNALLEAMACNASASEKLQAVVADQLLEQAREVVLRAASESSPEFSSFTAISDLASLSVEDQHRIFLHPTFRYWLQAMRRTAAGKDPERHTQFLAELPGLIWGFLAARGKLANTMRIRTDLWGGIRCPALGRYIELGEAYANQTIEVAPRDDGVRLSASDGLSIFVPKEDLTDPEPLPPPNLGEHGYNLTIARHVADGRVQVSARDPWLRVVLTGTMQRRDGTEFFGVEEALYTDDPPIDRLNQAFELVRKYWPEQYYDIPRFSHVLVPADFGPNLTSAFTVSSRQGAIYIGDGSPDQLVEMILHENAHVKLRQVQALDTLLADPLDETIRVPVPWRPDPRPMPGVFEGLFVFSHIAEYHKRRSASADPANSGQRLQELAENLDYAASCLQTHAQLTPVGVGFLAQMRDWVRSFQS